jgi:lipopolysaccharide export system protein LptA
MGVARILVLVAACGIVSVDDAGAQQGCEFVEGSGNLRTVDSGSGPITYVSTPNLVCPDGVRIRADSAASFQSSNYVQLLGNVRFEDPDRRLTAQTAEYFTTVGRLQARGSSELVQKVDSSAVRGEEIIYERAGPDRARSQLDVRGGRPTARLYMSAGNVGARAGAETSRVPYDVAADQILLEGDSLFRARGGVEIYRNDLQAFGDSVEYDQVAGNLLLMANALMILNGREIKAEVITVAVPGDVVEEVEARHNAVLTAEDFRLQAPSVRVFFADGVMERLVAIPITREIVVPDSLPPVEPPSTEADRSRPVAVADDFEIVADSLDMLAPGEVLERINATGSARAESATRDSLNTPDTPPFARTDWMEGDTIIAMFTRVAQDSVSGVAAPDSVREQYRLERLTAVGEARSFYRIEPNDSARARGDRRTAVHYVTAAAITLELDDGTIAKMEVRGQIEGIHAEPTLIGVPSDSITAPGDTAGATPVDSVITTGGMGSAVRAPSPQVRPEILGASPALQARSTRRRPTVR